MRVLTPLIQLGRLAYHLYTNDAGGKRRPMIICIFVLWYFEYMRGVSAPKDSGGIEPPHQLSGL